MTDTLFDDKKYRLGSLCKHTHEWKDTGKSLRYVKGKQECIKCVSEQKKRQAKKQDRERLTQKNREYRQKKAKQEGRVIRNWQRRTDEERKEYIRQWRQKNKERLKVLREARQPQIARRNRERYHSDPCYRIKRLKQNRKWELTESGQISKRQSVRKRHALEKNIEIRGSYTANQWMKRLGDFQYCCAYCGRSDCDLTVDHVQAVNKGGTNFIFNLVPACEHCNKSKCSRDVWEWYREQSFYNKAQENWIRVILLASWRDYQGSV